MKEIRLHGRGGQGVVKASHIIVKAAVANGKSAQFIPFFGVERKGSPVFGYLRISESPIRRKTQIYYPDILVIFDDSLIDLPSTYEGLKEGGTAIINSAKPIEALHIPPQAGDVAVVDATAIALDTLGREIPNTAMLGALAKVVNLAYTDTLLAEIEVAFGSKNKEAAQRAYDAVRCVGKECRNV